MITRGIVRDPGDVLADLPPGAVPLDGIERSARWFARFLSSGELELTHQTWVATPAFPLGSWTTRGGGPVILSAPAARSLATFFGVHFAPAVVHRTNG